MYVYYSICKHCYYALYYKLFASLLIRYIQLAYGTRARRRPWPVAGCAAPRSRQEGWADLGRSDLKLGK